VTFLLFLASLAVLEYLLRDVSRKSGAVPKSRETRDFVDYVANDASAADLLSLGRALDAQQSDKTTTAEQTPKASALK
jgi:hypothetical protein